MTDQSEMSNAKEKHRIIQDLVLLGILASKPMHGYEIRKEINEKLYTLVGIRPRSIYYSLDKLEKRGLLTSFSARTGNRPKKLVYELNDAGMKELKKLLIENTIIVDKLCLNLDISLYFLKHLEPSVLASALEKRLEALKRTMNEVNKDKERLFVNESKWFIQKISEHNQNILKEEMRFTHALLQELKEPVR